MKVQVSVGVIFSVILWGLFFECESRFIFLAARTSGNTKFYPRGLTPIIPRRKLKQDKYSIIYLTSFKRIPILSNTLNKLFQQHSQHCEKIYLYWNDFNRSKPAPSMADYNISNPPIPIEIIDTGFRKLYARFLIPESLETQTIFSIDDDIYACFAILDKFFNDFANTSFPYAVAGHYATLWRKGEYLWKQGDDFNIILTGLSFMRVELFENFNLDKYQVIRDYIGIHDNCEDFAMNFIVYDVYRNRPIHKAIGHQYIPTVGLSQKPTHERARVECLQYYDKVFGFHEITAVNPKSK